MHAHISIDPISIPPDLNFLLPNPLLTLGPSFYVGVRDTSLSSDLVNAPLAAVRTIKMAVLTPLAAALRPPFQSSFALGTISRIPEHYPRP